MPAWECLPAAELAGSAEPILEPQLWWPSTQGQFWRAPGKPAFGRSGMRKPTKPERRASRSALGVLQLAYFSMRCGLLPGIKVRRTLSKIVPCGLSWVNAETGPRGYLWHGTETFTCPLIVQLYESDLPAAERQVWIAFSNGSSRGPENHAAATALNYFAYNFIKIHRTLRMSPAMARWRF